MRDSIVKISDVIFTVVIVAVVLLLWYFAFPKAAGKTIEIRQNGELIKTMPLIEDDEFVVEGQYINVFEIKDGRLSVSYTDCPNRQCQKMGSVGSSGGSIICAPNRVSATVEGGGIDAFTG